eukprot:2562939-Rhodomonas_salina.1
MHIYAAIDRHRAYGETFPFTSRGVKRFRVIETFERLCGVPCKEAPAFTASHLSRVLHLPRRTLSQIRDAAIVAVGALWALRVEEITAIDVCDVLFDHDGAGTLAIRIKKRKNDQKRAGLWPRIGEAQDPALDVISLIRAWMARAGLSVHSGCEKGVHPRSTCR